VDGGAGASGANGLMLQNLALERIRETSRGMYDGQLSIFVLLTLSPSGASIAR
jgi:hypothetical protein